MKRIVQGLAIFTSLLLAAESASALQLGWADEFVTFEASCEIGGTNGCSGVNLRNGPDAFLPYLPARWSIMGKQGANAGGRANAREKAMFTFRDVTTTDCATATLTLSRYRTGSPPVEGSACTGGSSFGASQVTMDSCLFALSETYSNNRLLPVLDFSNEIANPGTYVGYRSLYSLTATQNMGGGGATMGTGCYRIYWQ